MDNYDVLKARRRELWEEQARLRGESRRVADEIDAIDDAMSDIRCTLFEKIYGWGRDSLLKVPPEWDTRRISGEHMGANTVWKFSDTTLEYNGEAGATVELIRTHPNEDVITNSINIDLEDALILREYWLSVGGHE